MDCGNPMLTSLKLVLTANVSLIFLVKLASKHRDRSGSEDNSQRRIFKYSQCRSREHQVTEKQRKVKYIPCHHSSSTILVLAVLNKALMLTELQYGVATFKPGQSREHTWSCRVRHSIDQGRAVVVSTEGRPSRQSGGPHVWREGSIQYGCIVCPWHCKNKNKQKWSSVRPGLWLSMHYKFICQTTSAALNFNCPCEVNTMTPGQHGITHLQCQLILTNGRSSW